MQDKAEDAGNTVCIDKDDNEILRKFNRRQYVTFRCYRPRVVCNQPCMLIKRIGKNYKAGYVSCRLLIFTYSLGNLSLSLYPKTIRLSLKCTFSTMTS